MSDLDKFSTTIIKGTLSHVKKEYDNHNTGSKTISFVVERQSPDAKFSHHYLIEAESKSGDDRFGIYDHVGSTVVCHCYVNGRVREGTKGQYHIIQLKLNRIEVSHD